MTHRRLRVLVGTTSSRYGNIEKYSQIEDWASEGARWWDDEDFSQPDVKHRACCISGRVDLSRSILFDAAKKAQADVHVQVDADCRIYTNVRIAMVNLIECFSAGFDVVIWPTIDHTRGTLMVSNLDPELKISEVRGPWEITGGAFGGVGFSKRALHRAVPLEGQTAVDGSKLPLYMLNGAEGSRGGEDYDFCSRLREAGLRICADPRVVIAHGKEQDLIAQYPGLQREQDPARALDEARAKRREGYA